MGQIRTLNRSTTVRLSGQPSFSASSNADFVISARQLTMTGGVAMALLGNIIWFVFGGWALFFIYTLGAIIFFPFFVPLFRLAVYSAWPFGRSVITRNQLSKYHKYSGDDGSELTNDRSFRAAGGVLNFLWLITFGWILALLHLAASIANLLLFFLIITIPNIAGHWKLMPVALMPFDKIIVPSSLAKEIKVALAKSKIGISA